MKFNIKCATFVRLAKICDFFLPSCQPYERERLNCVRLEIADGKIYAIVTNQQVAAIELVGNVSDVKQKGCVHVKIDQQMIEHCKTAAFFDGTLTIDSFPEMAMANATSTIPGWAYTGSPCYWWDETPLNDWRTWVPDEPVKKHEGIMQWSMYQVQALAESCPTGELYFPKFIDSVKPVVLRDCGNPYWVGLFVPKPQGSVQKVAAELPDWWF